MAELTNAELDSFRHQNMKFEKLLSKKTPTILITIIVIFLSFGSFFGLFFKYWSASLCVSMTCNEKFFYLCVSTIKPYKWRPQK